MNWLFIPRDFITYFKIDRYNELCEVKSPILGTSLYLCVTVLNNIWQLSTLYAMMFILIWIESIPVWWLTKD